MTIKRTGLSLCYMHGIFIQQAASRDAVQCKGYCTALLFFYLYGSITRWFEDHLK